MFTKCLRTAYLSRSQTVYRHVVNGFCQSEGRAFASATHPQTADTGHAYRTSVDDPRHHTLDHVGLYYKVSEEEKNTLFNNCIHSDHLRLMKTFNEACFMVRKPSLELINYIKNINLNHPVARFVLYGRKGAGKDCVMNHAMHACYRDNWIIVHVPWAGRWIRGWKKEITESTYKLGRYDLPTDGADWLSHFLTQNQGRLKDLITTSEYIWTKREKTDVGTPLEELIKFGLSRIKFSSDCVGAVLKELRHQAQAGRFKIFVGVSSVNAFFVHWDCKNSLRSPDKKLLHPNEISLIYNFKKMLSPTWTQGVVVCTVDETVNMLSQRENYTPKYLLGQEGFEALDPYVPILVPEYSEKETLSNIDYFIENNWIQNEYGKTEEGKKELLFVSNKNPFKLFQLCSSL